ncbi:hypothetical protein AUC70_03205 [Methyloceanibacter stevinii]|uniref:Exostosin GT47 domain-containing protein n=1 Tax=Methyloceanibacter stevinii TaxID=1774970 RepID=A0A1E3VQS4_9HYPH|nr:exostosin family protein [Methyloceanibacter stevinii]ODR95879.1 hypothetical protein AUC70_03205 [Methyloceanibacter stevinii]
MDIITAPPSEAYDWQWPAITERYATDQIRHSAVSNSDFVYIGFPWATLIDLLGKKQGDPRLKPMIADLFNIRREVKRWIQRATVCQHINMMHWLKTFGYLGITDIFWSHKVKGVDSLVCGDHTIRLHPFPLFPVQYARGGLDQQGQRPLLFSFVGLGEHPKYLTDVRAIILRILSEDSRGLVVGRDSWHYQKVVYEYQVGMRAKNPDGLIDDAASEQHISALRDSVFCLCPSGTGPNTIRLWEAIGSGCIPVIMSETYDPPGVGALWEAAAIFCPETVDAVKGLPDRLEAMAQDSSLMALKRQALKQLWSTYGPDSFVRDVELLCAGESWPQRALWPRV